MSARRARSSSRARTRRESDWQVLRPDGSTCWLALGRAGSFAERLLGLLGGPAPAPGHGLLLAPCRAVHSFGMHVSIDLVFVDEPGRVLATVEGFRPWRVAFCPRARSTVELRAGEA